MLGRKQIQSLPKHIFVHPVHIRRHLSRCILLIAVGQRDFLALLQIPKVQYGTVLQIAVGLGLRAPPQVHHLPGAGCREHSVIVPVLVRRENHIIPWLLFADLRKKRLSDPQIGDHLVLDADSVVLISIREIKTGRCHIAEGQHCIAPVEVDIAAAGLKGI